MYIYSIGSGHCQGFCRTLKHSGSSRWRANQTAYGLRAFILTLQGEMRITSSPIFGVSDAFAHLTPMHYFQANNSDILMSGWLAPSRSPVIILTSLRKSLTVDHCATRQTVKGIFDVVLPLFLKVPCIMPSKSHSCYTPRRLTFDIQPHSKRKVCKKKRFLYTFWSTYILVDSGWTSEFCTNLRVDLKKKKGLTLQ